MANLFTCEFHLKQDFTKKGTAGQADGRLYSTAMRLSKRNQAEVELLVDQMGSTAGLVKKRDKKEIFPAFLPPDTGTHGNTTGNAAEVSHRLFGAARSQPSLYKSMRVAVEVLHRREMALRDEYLDAAARALGRQNASQVVLEETAPGDALPAAVYKEFRLQNGAAMCLPAPEMQHSGRQLGEAPTYSIEDGGDTIIVSPGELLVARYESACSCQNNANRTVFCKHVQRCLTHSKFNWVLFVKPWQKVRTATFILEAA